MSAHIPLIIDDDDLDALALVYAFASEALNSAVVALAEGRLSREKWRTICDEYRAARNAFEMASGFAQARTITVNAQAPQPAIDPDAVQETQVVQLGQRCVVDDLGFLHLDERCEWCRRHSPPGTISGLLGCRDCARIRDARLFAEALRWEREVYDAPSELDEDHSIPLDVVQEAAAAGALPDEPILGLDVNGNATEDPFAVVRQDFVARERIEEREAYDEDRFCGWRGR